LLARVLDLAAQDVRVVGKRTALETEEGAGKAGCPPHPWSACNKKHAAEPQVQADHPAFPAQWFYGLYVISPVTIAWLPPSFAEDSATLAPALERQDHTTSPSAQATFVSRAIRVHRIPASRIVTIGRNVPLHRGGMRERIVLICPTPQARTRATDWHDGQFAHGVNAETAPVGHLSWHRGVFEFPRLPGKRERQRIKPQCASSSAPRYGGLCSV
jgi:hypothetical protein